MCSGDRRASRHWARATRTQFPGFQRRARRTSADYSSVIAQAGGLRCAQRAARCRSLPGKRACPRALLRVDPNSKYEFSSHRPRRISGSADLREPHSDPCSRQASRCADQGSNNTCQRARDCQRSSGEIHSGAETGRLQAVSGSSRTTHLSFDAVEEPLNVALLIDTSRSTLPVWTTSRARA